MVDSIFEMLFDLICNYFVENFHICVYQGLGSIVFFFEVPVCVYVCVFVPLSNLGTRVVLTSQDGFGRILFFQFFGVA
jgi:hypothetical protein